VRPRDNGMLVILGLIFSALIAISLWLIVLPLVRQTLDSQTMSACRGQYFVRVTIANEDVNKAVAKTAKNSGEIQAAAIHDDQATLDYAIGQTPALNAGVDEALARADAATVTYGKAVSQSLRDPAAFLATCR
jgi:hypothetical protein